MFGCVFKSETVIKLTIPIIGGLKCRWILINDQLRIEGGIASKLDRVLVPKQSLLLARLVVSYVTTLTDPANIIFLRFFERIHQGSHSLVVGRIRFHKVSQMEPVSLIFSSILNSEEVPLSR
jgi:hypothetical protein